MSTAAIMGWARAVGIGTVDPVTKQLEVESCGIGKQGVHVESNGIRGSRSHIAESVNDGPYTVGGPMVLQPRPDDLDDLLPWIMGSTFSGAVISIGDTLTDRYVTVDKGAKVYTYDGCRVNTAMFRSSAGQNLSLEMDIQGKDEAVGDAGSFPAISGTLSNLQPYIHHQAVITLDGTARQVSSVEISINNNLILDRFLNSQTRTELPSGDLNVSLTVDNPFTIADLDLYDLAVAGIAGTVVYTNGLRSITFSFANLKVPAQVIALARQGELTHRLPFTAYRTSSTALLTVTNDQTA
jgi:hypothetical protein